MELPNIKMEVRLEEMAMYMQEAISDIELEEYIKEHMDEAIERYDFKEEVIKRIHQAMDRNIEHYFECGKGDEIVSGLVEMMLNESFGVEQNDNNG